MWHLTFDPTGGFILNVAGGAEPGLLSGREREHLRTLARQVAEIAAEPAQQQKRDRWYRHIALERTRPMLLVFLEDSWLEVLPVKAAVEVRDPFWGQYEWTFKHLLYRDAHLHDDFVVEPDLYVPMIFRTGDWGIEAAEYSHTENERGSYNWTPPLRDPDDIRKLRRAEFAVDTAATQKRFDAVRDLFGDLLGVHLHCPAPGTALYDMATHLRGIEQCMLDMYDRPQWLHELMDFLSAEMLSRFTYLEEGGFLTLNNRNHYVDSGGIGYTRELPAAGYDGRHVRMRDLWCHGVAQAASEIGPEQHEEFILGYDLRILERAGLNAYGCCEPYTHKFEMLKRRIPRLRRVSVSPWCDVGKAAEALADQYICSWKPNPAMLVGQFHREKIRPYVRRALETARDCAMEIILKDTITLNDEPRRVEEWIGVVREEIDRLWA